jgi:hypothetical protein
MDNIDATNQGDVSTVEKHGRGRPCCSKNKPKSLLAAVTSSSTPAKRRPRRPLGSKNNKSTIVTADPVDRLYISFSHPSALSSSSGNLFFSSLLLVPNAANSCAFSEVHKIHGRP